MLFHSIAAGLAAAAVVQAAPQENVKIVHVKSTNEPTRSEPRAEDASHAFSGPSTTLKPAVHWDTNTLHARKIIPVPPAEGNKMYYGHSNPTEAGSFAFLTYYFDQPSVNLDECGQVDKIEYKDKKLSVKFKNAEAYGIAQDTWSGDDGMILVTYTEGCGAYDSEERCYFKVTGLNHKDEDMTIIAEGEPGHPSDLASYGESEWGFWQPDEKKKDDSVVNAAAASTPVPSPQSKKTRSGCIADADEKNGLPTACFGKLFDAELDDLHPNGPLSEDQEAFLEKINTVGKNGSATTRRDCGFFCQAYEKVKRDIGGFFNDVGNKIGDTANKVGETAGNVVDKVGEKGGEVVDKVGEKGGEAVDKAGEVANKVGEKAGEAVDKAGEVANKVGDKIDEITTFSEDFDHDIEYMLPNPKSPITSFLVDAGIAQVPSPWGPALLMKSSGVPAGTEVPPGSRVGTSIWCVDCGVAGTARIAGKATWKPTEGVSEAYIEFWNDMQFILQLGIDSRSQDSFDLKFDLFTMGLPGLSFGAVVIGPYVTVGARFKMQTASEGKMLMGAEMGLQNAHVKLDLKNKDNTKADSWDPYVNPVLQVEGDIGVSAELGLPISIRCGIKIATFDLSAGLVDEPSVKVMAQTASSIGKPEFALKDGFKDAAGCDGISAQVSWRNKFWAEVFNMPRIDLHDTKDMPLDRGCMTADSLQLKRRTLPGNKYQAAAIARREKLQSMVVDTTAEQIPANNTGRVTYSMKAMAPSTYKDASGHEFSGIITPSGEDMIGTCSNGNVYAFPNKPLNVPACSSMWTLVDGHVVSDGNKRVMHYYKDTMSALGVSRLRVAEKSSLPTEGELVMLGPSSQGDAYDAFNPADEVFHPVMCTFEEAKNHTKVFLVKDLVEGVKTLQSEDAQHTVTGGKVKECKPLGLKQGKSESKREAKYMVRK